MPCPCMWILNTDVLTVDLEKEKQPWRWNVKILNITYKDSVANEERYEIASYSGTHKGTYN